MSSWIPAVIAVVVIAGVLVVVWQRASRSNRESAHATVASRQIGAIRWTQAGRARNDYLRNLSLGSEIILADPTDPERAMIFGQTAQLASYGESEGSIPAQIAKLLIPADALAKVGASSAEQAGILVRLTKDSSTAYRALYKTVEADGAVQAVFRDANGAFQHVARFKPAQVAQTAASMTSLLSAVAMQAQLAAIERSIERLRADVARVQAHLDDDWMAQLRATRETLDLAYRGAQISGVLTETSWSTVAPLASTVRKNRKFARMQLQRKIQELAETSDVGDRRHWMREGKHDQLFRAWMDVLDAEAAAVQHSMLLGWRMSCTNDPALDFYTAEVREQIDALGPELDAARRGLIAAIETAGMTSTWDEFLSPFDSGVVKTEFAKLLEHAHSQPLPSLGRVTTHAAADTFAASGSPGLESREAQSGVTRAELPPDGGGVV